VPLDGTAYAEQAIPTAVILGRALTAEVVLVRAHPAAPASADDSAQARPLRRRERETQHSASLYLARKEQELRARGVRVSSRLPLAPAAEAIAATAAERSAALIVIATHLGTTFSRPSQVSVAHELLRRAEVPVLLLSSTMRTPFDRMDGQGLTLLVPLEGSPGGASAVPYAAALAQALSGQVLLLRAVGESAAQALRRDDPALFAVAMAPQCDQVIGYLERLRGQLLRQHVAAWTGIVYGDLLQETARQAHVGGELIMLGRSEQSPDQGEATIHAALTLLHRTRVPLLIVPPRASVLQKHAPVSTPDGVADPALAEEASQ
jgi:nucleotide-binding universal stress UspA family protein